MKQKSQKRKELEEKDGHRRLRAKSLELRSLECLELRKIGLDNKIQGF